MPAPVQGALPRAVKAIQARKEKTPPKERRQASQKRREYVKGKVLESAKLKEQRRDFNKKRNSFRVQIQRAIFSDEYTKESELRNKLKRLEDEVGSRLRMPASTPIDGRDVKDRLARARSSFKLRMIRLSQRIKKAAEPDDPRARPNKRLYDELEKKMLGFSKKDSPLWDYSLRPLKNYEQGKTWRQGEESRRLQRRSKLYSVYERLVKEASQAASEGNKSKYVEAENKILKIASRAGDKIGLRDRPTKGSLWRDERVPKALKGIMTSMENSLSSGELSKYNSLEAKFIKARDNYLSGSQTRGDKLFISGGPRMLAGKGQVITEHLGKLKMDMLSEARSKNRREYDRLERTLLRLRPEEKKGRIWREQVESRVRDYIPILKEKIRRAIADGNRKEYNRLERVLLRLSPEETKGRMWRESRVRNYLPTLERKLRMAAAEGNRREYNKIERILFRIDPNRIGVRGSVWKKERVNETVNKLRDEMDKAINANDRAKYDRLEAKFFKIRDRVGSSTIADYDLRYVSRGELWRDAKSKAMTIPELESALNKGRRDGVGKIKIEGDGNGFNVVSDVRGNRLELSISPGNSTSFRVNDSYTASDDLPRREAVAITREVRRQYNEVMKNMEDDTVFKVSAASGDGREDMRVKAYTDFGFSTPDSSGYMYGVVRGGKIEPIDEDEYYLK